MADDEAMVALSLGPKAMYPKPVAPHGRALIEVARQSRPELGGQRGGVWSAIDARARDEHVTAEQEPNDRIPHAPRL
jgi:hypothetical protein